MIRDLLRGKMKKAHKSKGWWSISDLTVALETPSHLIYRARRLGVIPEPTHTMPGGTRKYYTGDEARKIVADLKAEVVPENVECGTTV